MMHVTHLLKDDYAAPAAFCVMNSFLGANSTALTSLQANHPTLLAGKIAVFFYLQIL